MKIRSTAVWIALGVVSLTAAGCAASDGGETEAVASESAALVSDGYGLVPGGLSVHVSCVKELPAGASVDIADGAIIHQDGHHETVSPCTHPAFNVAPHAGAKAASSGPAPITASHVWVEEADWSANGTVGAMAADWQVPPAPASNHGQTIFLFPALQHTFSTPAPIIQPVLQWGPSQAGGGAYWATASWFGPINGVYYHSGLQWAGSGDSIRGVMNGSSCSGQHCSTWDIRTYNQTRGYSTGTTYYNNPDGLWRVSGAVLETVGTQVCSDLPSGYTGFNNVHVRDLNGNLMNPSWSAPVYYNECGNWVWGADSTDVYLGY